MSSFSDRVRVVVRDIEKGQVLSYREVAYRAGNVAAARAVARVMAGNRDPSVPCHRVIRADGRPGGYNSGGEERKRAILRSEGVDI